MTRPQSAPNKTITKIVEVQVALNIYQDLGGNWRSYIKSRFPCYHAHKTEEAAMKCGMKKIREMGKVIRRKKVT